jgi:hypothetical protein
VSLTVEMNADCDLLSDDEGYLDVRVEPDLVSLDYSCADWTATWQIYE